MRRRTSRRRVASRDVAGPRPAVVRRRGTVVGLGLAALGLGLVGCGAPAGPPGLVDALLTAEDVGPTFETQSRGAQQSQVSPQQRTSDDPACQALFDEFAGLSLVIDASAVFVDEEAQLGVAQLVDLDSDGSQLGYAAQLVDCTPYRVESAEAEVSVVALPLSAPGWEVVAVRSEYTLPEGRSSEEEFVVAERDGLVVNLAASGADVPAGLVADLLPVALDRIAAWEAERPAGE
jgi:hypothetical protein